MKQIAVFCLLSAVFWQISCAKPEKSDGYTPQPASSNYIMYTLYLGECTKINTDIWARPQGNAANLYQTKETCEAAGQAWQVLFPREVMWLSTTYLVMDSSLHIYEVKF